MKQIIIFLFSFLLTISSALCQNIFANTDTVAGYIYIFLHNTREHPPYFFSKDLKIDFFASLDTYIQGYPSSGWIIEKMAQDSGFYYLDYDKVLGDSLYEMNRKMAYDSVFYYQNIDKFTDPNYLKTGYTCSCIKEYDNLKFQNPQERLMVYKTQMVVKYVEKGKHFVQTPNLRSRFKKIIPICSPYNQSTYIFTIIPYFSESILGGACKG